MNPWREVWETLPYQIVCIRSQVFWILNLPTSKQTRWRSRYFSEFKGSRPLPTEHPSCPNRPLCARARGGPGRKEKVVKSCPLSLCHLGRKATLLVPQSITENHECERFTFYLRLLCSLPRAQTGGWAPLRTRLGLLSSIPTHLLPRVCEAGVSWSWRIRHSHTQVQTQVQLWLSLNFCSISSPTDLPTSSIWKPSWKKKK